MPEAEYTPEPPKLTETEMQISFQFRVNSRVDNGTGFEDRSPLIKEVGEHVAKDPITLNGEVGKIDVSPFMYGMDMPIGEITVESLEDKYQTALGYLHMIVDETPRHLRPTLIIHVNSPNMTAADVRETHEDTIRAFSDTLFGEEGKAELKAESSYFKIRYTDAIVTL